MKYLIEPDSRAKNCGALVHYTQITALFFVLTMAGFTFSNPAQAGILHGATIQKLCAQNRRQCTDNASCTDNNACTTDTCDTAITNVTSCLIRITHDDGFGDTLSITAAFDTEDFGGDNVRVPAVGNLPIAVVNGNSTCVVGAFAPCTIGPDLGGGAGQVTFESNTYVVQPTDPDPLPDQGTVTIMDQCNSGDPGCSGSSQSLSQPGQTDLVTGCTNGAPTDCDDQNACTTDSCDPATGECINAPTDCDDQNACTTDSCDPATGACVNNPTVCDDGSACTTDSCDPATGCVTAPVVCDDQDACTTDSCDPATGCETAPVDCDDQDVCTADSCDPATGQCANDPIPGCGVVPRATFAVTKEFTDGDNPTLVDVTISCYTGLPLIQTQTINENQGVTFVVESFEDGTLDCDIDEALEALGLTGYTPTYTAGGTPGGTSDADGCHFDDVPLGAENTCHIVNDPDPVPVVIVKDWIIEGEGGDQVDQHFDLTLYCDAVIVGGYPEKSYGYGGCGGAPWLTAQGGTKIAELQYESCLELSGNGDTTFTAHVIPEWPDSHCWVVEDVYDDAVEVDNGCLDITVSHGQGAECLITNTVFFEGIPSLSQYGMAILALLMLGAGLVGFRRFA